MNMLSFKQYLKEESRRDLFLNGWAPEQYIVNSDGSVDWKGGINFSGSFLEDLDVDKFPVNFKSSKNFTYIETRPLLTTLENSPDKVDGTYNIIAKKITDLSGSPKEVTENYIIGTNFTSVKGITPVIGNHCKLMSNDLRSLSGISECESISGSLFIYPKMVRSSILGILKIKNLDMVQFMISGGSMNLEYCKPFNIVNKHLESGRRLSKCKQELEDAGFKEYAKL
jgi:hypothetical protein